MLFVVMAKRLSDDVIHSSMERHTPLSGGTVTAQLHRHCRFSFVIAAKAAIQPLTKGVPPVFGRGF